MVAGSGARDFHAAVRGQGILTRRGNLRVPMMSHSTQVYNPQKKGWVRSERMPYFSRLRRRGGIKFGRVWLLDR